MALCVIEQELLSIKVLHCPSGDFLLYCSCDIDLDPTTFTYEFDPYPFEYTRDIPDVRKSTSCVKAFESYRITYIDTYQQIVYIRHRHMGGQ